MTLEQEEKIFQQWSTTNKPLPEIAEAAGVRYCEAAEYIETITTEQERMERMDRCEAAAKPERREPWQDNETKEEAGPEQAAEPETEAEAEEATEEDYLEHAADRPEPEEAEQPEAKDTAAEQKIEKNVRTGVPVTTGTKPIKARRAKRLHAGENPPLYR